MIMKSTKVMNDYPRRPFKYYSPMKPYIWILLLLAGCLTTSTAIAKPHPQQRVNDAIDVLQQFVHIPENAIPPALLHRAKGIAIFPGVIKVGFMLAVRRGNGIVAVRKPNGKWSKPIFATLTSGSLGFQAGASSTDVVLVFKTRRSVHNLAEGQFDLGGDASVAAGPVGRQTSASTNLHMTAEIYSYSRSRGLFAGVAIDGGRITIDEDANWLFYNKAGITANKILNHGGSLKMPKSGQRLVYTLNQYLPTANNQSSVEHSGRPTSNDNKNGNGSSGGGSSIGQASARKANNGVTVQRQQNGASKDTGTSGG